MERSSNELKKLRLKVREFSWHKAYAGFRANGISEDAYRSLLSQRGVTVLAGTYPNLFVVIDEAQISNIGTQASDFVQIGTSRGLGSSEEEALENFKEEVQGVDLILPG
jgi:hypothetical protein